jgi:hypothetical protein
MFFEQNMVAVIVDCGKFDFFLKNVVIHLIYTEFRFLKGSARCFS